jgi:Domain of unknown function (DUF5680)
MPATANLGQGEMMDNNFLLNLNTFIVRAKSVSYVGDGQPVPSCRPGSHDLKFTDGDWAYLDSYFGGRDFIGEEVVYFKGKPVWAMNYYGRILRSDLITPAQTGQVIKASLSKMYSEGRFLGGFEHHFEGFTYTDTSEGESTSFRGREFISSAGETVYELFYHGGLILDD